MKRSERHRAARRQRPLVCTSVSSGLCRLGLALLFTTLPSLAWNGSIYGPVNVDTGAGISGLAGATQNPTTNGNIRYQWRIVPTTSGNDRWLGFEWDSRTRVFAFYGNPTFTPNNDVIIRGDMDIGGGAYGWGNPGNFRINSVDTGKRLIFNITDSGNTLASAPGNDQIQLGLTEINHSSALVTTPDGSTTGLSTTRSGNNVVLQTSTTAENSGSNEELWYQWTHDNWTTKNFVQQTAIGASASLSIPLSASAPILREGDTVRWILALTGPSATGTVSASTGGLLNFDLIAINKSTIASTTITDDDTTGPGLSSFSISGKTDAEINAGGWTISGNIQDSGSGVNNNGTTVTGNDFSPNYDLLNNADTEVLANQVFTTRPADGAAQASPGTLSVSAGAVASGSIDLGTYKVRVSATDDDEDPTTAANDRTAVVDSQVATFTVTDDDTVGPVIGTPSYTTPTTASGTKTITVDITDATSATDEGTTLLYYGYSNPYNQNNVTEATGSGDGTYTFTIPDQTGNEGSSLFFYIVASDDDNDRSGDSSETVNNNGGSFFELELLPAAPATPANLAATDGTSTTQVDLTWDDVTGETGFVIWRHTANTFGSATAIFTNAADDTTYSDTSATVGTLYYYWVTATNTGGSSAESTSDSGFVELEAPANVSATDGTSTTDITVTWDTVSGATSYKVYRDTDSNPVGATDLGTQTSPFNDTTASAGTEYFYFVTAVDSSPSHESDFSTGDAGYLGLAAPGNVSASDGTSTAHVTVSWDAVSGATSYKVYRDTDSNPVGATDLGTQTSPYNDTTAAVGTEYFYFVTAVDSAPSQASDFSSGDSGFVQLEAPANVAATDGSSTAHVTVTWDSVSGATSYTVYRDTDTNPTGATDLGTQTSPFDDTGATPGQQYYYFVTAVDSAPSQESAFSANDDGFRKLATVGGVTASDGTSATEVTVDWTDITGETGYGIYRNTVDNSGSASYLASTAADVETYADGTVTPGQTYYYWVRATNSTSESQSDFSASDDGFAVNNATFEWDAGGGSGDRDWTTAANWTGDTVPNTDTNMAWINGNYTAEVTVAGALVSNLYVGSSSDPSVGSITTGTVEQTGGGLTVFDLFLGQTTDSGGTYDMSGGTLTVNDDIFVGLDGAGFMTVTNTADVFMTGGSGGNLFVGFNATGLGELNIGGNAEIFVANNLVLGQNVGSDATVGMYGGTLDVTNDIYVGWSGDATFTLDGEDALVTVGGELKVADSDANNAAFFHHNAGTVTVTDLRLARLSATEGQYIMTNGFLDVTNSIFIADGNGNSTGRMEVSGSARVNLQDDLIVGKDGLGVFSLFGNATVTVVGASSHLILGDDTGANKANQVQIDGSALLDIGGDMYLGDASESYGSLAVSGAVLSAVGDLFVGDDAGGTGAVQVTGGVIDLADEQGYVGYEGLGTYDQSGGTAAFQQFIVGDLTGSSGEATVSAGTLNTEDDLIVGGVGVGTLTISGTAAVNVGTNSSGDADFFVGQSSGGEGTVIQTGGTVSGYDNASLILGPVAGASGTYKISGGDLDLDFTGNNGDNIDIFYGTLHLVGDDWTITMDDDFTMNNASSALTVEFDASTLGTVSVDDDIILTGTLNVTNDASGIAAGSYTVITSENNSAISGTFSTINWLGGHTGTVTYANGAVVITFEPEIGVSGNDTDITNGDTTPSVTDDTDFGTTAVTGGTVDRTFTITNSGLFELTLGTVTIGGTHAADFSVTAQPSTPVDPDGVATFTVQFNPTASGLREAEVSIPNNDPDEDPFTFAIQGIGLADEPTVQAHTIAFSSLGSTSYTVSWSGGNGANSLVIARQGSAPSGGPVDETGYTADNDFTGSGSALGSGKVVYDGSGSSFTLTGLSPETEYFLQVFEYNGSGSSANYFTSTASGNPASRFTLATEPSGHVTGFSATPASIDEIDLSWTAAAGPPDGYLILQKTGSDPTGTPGDGQGYSVSDGIGDGTVVAIVTPGSATSTTIGSLTAGTAYHFSIVPFTWDGAEAETYNYRTAATIPTANATIPGEPTQAHSLVLDTRTQDSLDIEWTSGNGDGRIVVATELDAAGAWLMDEGAGTTVGDATPNENDGSFVGSPSWTTRNDAGALDLSGSGQMVSVADVPLGSGAPTGFSVSIWIYNTRAAPIYDYVVFRGASGGPQIANSIYCLHMHGGSNTVAWTVDGRVDEGASQYAVSSTLNQWVHLVGTYDGTDARLYINGTLEHTDTGVGAIGNVTTGNQLGFGGNPHDTSFRNVDGMLSEPVVYNYALSAGEISDLYAMTSSGLGWEPTDGTAPSGVNSDFSAATDQGFNSKIVYDGTGNSVAITGLKTNTAYRIRVFEYNGSGATINYNTDTATDNPETFATLDLAPGISEGDGLTQTATVGTDPATQTLVITNIGGSELSFDLSDNVGWLSLSAASGGPLGSGETESFTVTYDVDGLSAGVSNATITVTSTGTGDNVATNGPISIPVTLTLNAISDPTAGTATADGKEMVRLDWTAHGSYSTVMIVYDTAAISTEPTQGDAYAVGASIGSGTVLYKGTGSSLEHVLPDGTDAHYTFYSVNNDHYSAGIADSATLGSYIAGEIVEPFAYTNGSDFATAPSENGGSGWSGAWSVGAGTWSIDGDSMDVAADYPEESGNAVRLANPGNNSLGYMTREISPVSSGKLYVSGIVRFQYPNNDKFAGIELTSNGVAKAFFGEVRDQEKRPGVAASATANAWDYDGTYDMNDYSSDTGNVYLIVARYDFTSREFDMVTYYKNVTVPTLEPTTWNASTTLAAGTMDEIDGIRLVGGSLDAFNTIGDVYFDEIRVASTWAGLLNLGGVYVTNYIVGNASYEVTDQQVNEGAFAVSLYHYADSGVETVNTAGDFFIPNFDIWNTDGTQILTDHVFSAFAYQDNGRVAIGTNDTHVTVDSADVVLGVYTTRWSAIASNGVATLNSTTLSNGTEMTFTVIDDDTTAPTKMNIRSPESGASRLMHVSYNGSAVGANGAAADDITYTITDGELASMGNPTPALVFYFGAQDSGSGLHRGTTDPAVHSSLTIGSAILSNVGNWDITRSSTLTNTYDASATNAWSWIAPLSDTQIENLITNATSGLAGSNRVTLTFRDRDLDRDGDQESLVDEPYGWLVVEDDDTDGPEVQDFVIEGGNGVGTLTQAELTSGSGWSITGRVRDVDSGINVNGTSSTQPDSSPYYELWDESGTLRHTAVFDTFAFADGGATTPSSIGDLTPTSLASAPTGVWTAKVIVADNDEDWGGDRAFTTNEIVFDVIVGASQAGMSLGPSSFTVNSDFGNVSGSANWPWVDVTNNGIGTLTYDATIVYGGGSGWLSVDPDTGVSVNSGNHQPTEFEVDASSLNPGTYSATVTFDGNQTNTAQTVTVNLTVTGYYVNEIVDPFTNAVSTGVNGMDGGTGWDANWSTTPGGAFSVSAGNLSVPNNYPTAAGNRICGDATSQNIEALRTFSPVNTGDLFAAVAITKDAGDNAGFAGLSFMDGGAEEAFAGKLFNVEWFGLDVNGDALDSSFGIYANTYLLVIKYNFETDLVQGEVYNFGDTLSLTEPGSWLVTATNSGIVEIDGIRLAGGSVGNLCFDEIRVARTWETLLNQFTAEPTLHATGLTFFDVATNGMTVGWSPGNGGARIVVMREANATSFTPVDGNNYSGNSDFSAATDLGSGNKVVYNGSGTNVVLTGLTKATQYYVEIFEYNGTGGSEDYYTDPTPLAGDRWTLEDEPLNQPTAFAGTADSDTQIEATWTASAGTPGADGYLILYQADVAVSNEPSDGVGYTDGDTIGDATVKVITSGATETTLLAGLSPCDTYHFRIFAFGYDGANADTYNYNLVSPPFTDAETECVAPTLQSSNIVFSAIGTNTITATWDPGNGDGRIVVVRGTNTVNDTPDDGTTYTASATFGSGDDLGSAGNYVVYVGVTNQVTVTGLLPGETYSFQVFEYNGSGSGTDYNITTANDNPNDTETASFGIVYEHFDYADWSNLSGQSGGSGWTNNWVTTGGLVESSNGNFPQFGGYPHDPGTKAGFMDMDNGPVRDARRNFPARTSGQLFIGIKVSDNHSMGASDFLGVDLLDGTASTGFFGKAFGVADQKLSVEHNGVTSTNKKDGTHVGYQLASGTDFLLIAMYDFDAKELNVRSYISTEVAHAIPEKEDAWQVTLTNVHIDRIDGIKVVASDNNQIVSFDNIRIGPSWDEVVWDLPADYHADGPTPELVYIGTNYNAAFYSQVITNVSDAELRSATLLDFAVRWTHPDGVFLTNALGTVTNIGSPNGRVNPNWDPLAVGAATNEFNLDRLFENNFGWNGATSVTSYHFTAFNITNINFENEYFVTVSAETTPGGTTISSPNGGDAIPVDRQITINEPLRFYIFDDDTNDPIRAANSPLTVMTSTVVAAFQSFGPDLDRWFVTDGSLASAGMRVSLNAYDEYSGLQRASAGGPSTNLNLSIDVLTTENLTDYIDGESSADTTLSTATSMWYFASTVFDFTTLSDLWGGDGSGAQGQDLEVRATLPDADEDRVEDQRIVSNELFGLIRLLDDDGSPPYVTSIAGFGYVSDNEQHFMLITNGHRLDGSIRSESRRAGSLSNVVWTITDGEALNAGDNDVGFVFGAADLGSGVQRGVSGGTNSVMSFSIGDVKSGIFNRFDAGSSSPGTGDQTTNVFLMQNGDLVEADVDALLGVETPVYVTIPDADEDRQNDQAVLYSEHVGYFQVVDDDIEPPVMSNLNISVSSVHTLLNMGFEEAHGWTNGGSFASYGDYDNHVGTNHWAGTQVQVPSSPAPPTTIANGRRVSGTHVMAFRDNASMLDMPERSDLGTFFVWARLSSGTGPRELTLEGTTNGVDWTDFGLRNITDSEEYQNLSWTLEEPGPMTLRLRRTGNTDQTIYIDDIMLTKMVEWTNAATVDIDWDNAWDEQSGLYQYRLLTNATPTLLKNTNIAEGLLLSTNSHTIELADGINTGFVFSVDSDNDRSNDRVRGGGIPYVLKMDQVPPLAVASPRATDASASFLFGNIDESTEIKVEWAPGAGTEAEAAGWRASDNAPLAPWSSYQITYFEVDDGGTPVSGSITDVVDFTTAGWTNLGDYASTNFILSNLVFDAYYEIQIQGRDRAGNLGPGVIVTGNTDRFVVTQGLNRVGLDLEVRWKGVVGRDYDVLRVDSANGFQTTLSNQWSFMLYTNAPSMFDTGAVSRARPGELTNTTYRFYRVAKQDRWQATNATRLASEEIYVTKALPLQGGENWFSPFFIPDTSTVDYVFNTNLLPKAGGIGSATKIHWYNPEMVAPTGGLNATYSMATATIWLANSGWTWEKGGVGPAGDKLVPLDQAFNIELPTGMSTSLVLIGRVPTQAMERTASGPTSFSPIDDTQWRYHVLSYGIPTRTRLSDMGLAGAGLVGNNVAGFADEIRILSNTSGNGSLVDPKARLYLKGDGTTWAYRSWNTNDFTGAPPAPNNYIIEPNEAVVVVRRNPGTMVWTNALPYALPTKNMTP